MTISMIGGDERMRRLADYLRRDGHTVRSWALEEDGEKSLASALDGAAAVVLPLPATEPGGCLFAPFYGVPVPLEEVLRALPPVPVLCGRATAALRDALGPRLTDYFEREELTVRNAALTAEGAVGLLIAGTPFSLSGAEVLILGAGRIGKLLGLKLRALGARVTVAARRPESLALAESLGLRAVPMGSLTEAREVYDAVVNTIPARLLAPETLAGLGGRSCYLDLASAPFGCGEEEAARAGLRLRRAPGLPGKTAPESAARAIYDTVTALLEENAPDPE